MDSPGTVHGDSTAIERLTLPVAVGLVVALFGLEVLQFAFDAADVDLGPVVGTSVSLALSWVLALAVVALVLWWEDRPLASIGLERPSRGDLGWGLVGFVVGIFAFAVTTPLIEALGLSSTGGGIQELARLPIWLVVAVAITAGITEEVLYRGFPIERVAELTGNIWVGAAITFVLFTVAHVAFWGLGGAIQIGVWTVVVTVLYVRRRNLVACMLMHVLNDLFAFVLLPIVFY